jgi:thioredoxin reductase
MSYRQGRLQRRAEDISTMHDVIIIGSGAAGLSAAFWCDELGLDTLVLEEQEAVGGQLSQIYNR